MYKKLLIYLLLFLIIKISIKNMKHINKMIIKYKKNNKINFKKNSEAHENNYFI